MKALSSIRLEAWLWLLAMLVVAIGGSRLAGLAAAHVVAGPKFHAINIRLGFNLPIPVVNGAYGGWQVVGVVWITVALLAASGWLLTRSLARSGAPLFTIVVAQALVGGALTSFSIRLSADVYVYVIDGREYGIYRDNPYGSHAVAAHGDPILQLLLRYFGNPPPFDNYGPLWNLLAGLVAKLESGTALLFQVRTHRALALLAAVGSTLGVARMLRSAPPAVRLRRAGAFALHPTVLFETAAGGHTDIIMVALAIWAFAIADELPLVAGLLLGASIAEKYLSLFVLPFLIVYAGRSRARNGAAAGAIALITSALFLKPFWTGPQILYTLIGHGGQFGMSIGWLLNYWSFNTGTQNEPAFPGAPSLPFFGQLSLPRIVELGLFSSFALVAGWSIWRFAKMGRWANVWRTITAFLWASPIIHPWYLLWLSPALAASKRWGVYAWWFSILCFLPYMLDVTAPREVPIPLMFASPLIFLIAPIVIAIFTRRTAQRTGNSLS